MLRSTFVTRATLAVLLSLLSACGRLSDVLSPGRPEAYQQVPARVALSARLPAFTRGQVAEPQLRVLASYEQTGGTRVTLATVLLPLTDVATQTLPFSIDLSTCLIDRLREGAELGTGRAAVCLVSLELTLLDGDRVIDQQTVGPLRLLPGSTSTVPDAVSLFEVAGVRVVPPAGTPDGAVRLERGRALALTAAVTSTTGQVVAGRTVQWTSSAPAIARVDAATGAVTALAVGRVRISAATGARTGGIDLNIVPPPSAITITALTPAVGTGRVQSVPAGIDCRVANGQTTGTCTATFPGDAQVTLTAIPDSGAVFGSWGGACLAVGVDATCVLPADQPRTASIAFAALRTLTIGSAVASGDVGAGRVSSKPAGVDCVITGPDASGKCAAPFADGQAVTLTAEPADQHVFLGWTGDCAATFGPICTVTLAGGDRSASAIFGGPVHLSVGFTGPGSGAVSVQVNGQTTLVCGAGQAGACVATLPIGTLVTLIATPDAGSTFAGWTGACSGTGPCRVTIDQTRSVSATFVRRVVTLTLSLGGAGAGSVQVNGQTACSLSAGQGAATCRVTTDAGVAVTLTATPGTNATFSGWGGTCATATGTTCTLTPQADQTVGAAFARTIGVPLTVQAAAGATAAGTVTSAPAGITCTLNGTTATGGCSNSFAVGTSVTLTAAAAANARFVAWGGACSTATGSTCTVTMSAATTVSARFDVGQTLVTVVAVGTGGGTVRSAPAGIDCTADRGAVGGTCAAAFPGQSSVTLTANPDAASTFGGWSGACSGSAPTCTVDPAVAPTATATFTRAVVSGNVLSVSRTGTGVGTIGSNPGGIDCPTSCSASFPVGTVVTLTAIPAGGNTFGGWSGACSGTAPTCTVTMDAAKSATASFVALAPSVPLSVAIAGTGGGAVTSSPGGIACPGVCAVNFALGAVVTLTATPNPGSAFGGWSGACSGTAPTCTVTTATAQSVTASFSIVVPSFALTVSTSGAAGTVTSSPSGIACPSTCTSSFVSGTAVTLTAAPGAGGTFLGWSGACSGTGSCVVSMTAAQSVTASFAGPTFGLTVSTAGTGSGTVASTPAGIACPTTCAASYAGGTTVTLTATPNASSTFAGWSGACTGTGACQVLLDQARAVSATFTVSTPTLVTLSITSDLLGYGKGQITSSGVSPAISCTVDGLGATGACSGSYPAGTVVRLSASPASGSTFDTWSGPCASAGTGVCTLTLTSSTTVPVRFNAPSLHLVLRTTGVAGTVMLGVGGLQTPCSIAATDTMVNCDYNVPRGAVVSLDATPATAFLGTWDAPCDPARSTRTTCVFTLTSATPISVFGNFGPSTIRDGATTAAPLRTPPPARRSSARPSR